MKKFLQNQRSSIEELHKDEFTEQSEGIEPIRAWMYSHYHYLRSEGFHPFYNVFIIRDDIEENSVLGMYCFHITFLFKEGSTYYRCSMVLSN